jgi:hypothetical protein
LRQKSWTLHKLKAHNNAVTSATGLVGQRQGAVSATEAKPSRLPRAKSEELSVIPNYRSAIVKWNGGRGALLCNRCRTILREGIRHTDVEHFCDDCSGVRGSGDLRKRAGRDPG